MPILFILKKIITVGTGFTAGAVTGLFVADGTYQIEKFITTKCNISFDDSKYLGNTMIGFVGGGIIGGFIGALI